MYGGPAHHFWFSSRPAFEERLSISPELGSLHDLLPSLNAGGNSPASPEIVQKYKIAPISFFSGLALVLVFQVFLHKSNFISAKIHHMFSQDLFWKPVIASAHKF